MYMGEGKGEVVVAEDFSPMALRPIFPSWQAAH
jgi:hypothetical protein